MKGNEQQPQQERDLRELPKWARRYAQNRTLPVLVLQVMYLVGAGVFGGLSYLGAWAYMHGERLLAASSVLVLSAFAAWWLWFGFSGAAKLVPRITARLYGREGTVTIGQTPEGAVQRLPSLVWFLVLFCVFAHVGLSFWALIPMRLMQPTSALYAVPFLIYLGMRLRQVGSPLMFLWPALYALHAMLLLAGAPIYFGGRYQALNMLIPTVGYGILAALAGHIYSRVALRRLRALAATPETTQEGVEEVR